MGASCWFAVMRSDALGRFGFSARRFRNGGGGQVPYRPVQRGFRFSRNALTPSWKSAVVRMRTFSSTAHQFAIKLFAGESPQQPLRRMQRRRAVLQQCVANSWTRSIRLSAATTSVASPSRKASSALMILPVNSRSRACFSPTWRSRNVDTIAGRTRFALRCSRTWLQLRRW